MHAEGTLRWLNTTSAPAVELCLHLYLNAFASSETTFMRGLGGRTLRGGEVEDGAWGWIELERLATSGGDDLLGALEYVRPDDGNPDDFTVAIVPLPEPVPPASAVELELAFTSQLPRVIARSGWAGDFHLVGQWYPKPGVFRGEEGWSCHQYGASTEFFADFGSYRVALTVPEKWVVGATGIEVGRTAGDGTVEVVYRAERVHDFVWTTAPEDLMAVVEESFEPGRDVPEGWLARTSELLGAAPAELELPPVNLRLLVPRAHLPLAGRMLDAARLGIAWLGLHYGPYPYPQLTLVSPPPTAEEAGGMEYPTFVTTGASALLRIPPLTLLSWIESVTVHEIGHQYFQGLLASDEVEQPWLDEGLTTFVELEFMESIVAEGLTLVPSWLPAWAGERLSFAGVGHPLTVDTPAWAFRRRSDYGDASYTKAALAMKTLQGLLGEATFARGMRLYADRYRFDHPDGEDLRSVFEEVAGEDLGWFFAQAIEADAEVDFAVLGVRQWRPEAARGMILRNGEWVEIEEADEGASDAPATDGPWTVEVDVGRIGGFVGPVDLLLLHGDDPPTRLSWDGRERWRRFTLESVRRVTAVAVDPDGVWALETRRDDNYWRGDHAVADPARWSWWASGVLGLLATLPVPWS